VPWRLQGADAVALLRRLGIARVCFGSDFPWFDPAADAARVAALPGLTDAERAAVLGENARRLLGSG
jgi:predicted TIM-barrel fold metal-dependent hydrolase